MKVPDGMRLLTPDRGALLVFDPPWWRIDRWIFWAWLVLFAASRARGVVKFSEMRGSKLEERVVRAYAERG